MEIEFDGEIWYWKGPAPWFFVTVPADHADDLKGISGLVTYGWGMVPVTIQIGRTLSKTALFPKDGSYLVPVKVSVREAENLKEGDIVTVRVQVNL